MKVRFMPFSFAGETMSAPLDVNEFVTTVDGSTFVLLKNCITTLSDRNNSTLQYQRMSKTKGSVIVPFYPKGRSGQAPTVIQSPVDIDMSVETTRKGLKRFLIKATMPYIALDTDPASAQYQNVSASRSRGAITVHTVITLPKNACADFLDSATPAAQNSVAAQVGIVKFIHDIFLSRGNTEHWGTPGERRICGATSAATHPLLTEDTSADVGRIPTIDGTSTIIVGTGDKDDPDISVSFGTPTSGTAQLEGANASAKVVSDSFGQGLTVASVPPGDARVRADSMLSCIMHDAVELPGDDIIVLPTDWSSRGMR